MIDVRKIREANRLTQQELAEMCGVSARTVQNWEMGKKIPDSTIKLLQTFNNEGETISSEKPIAFSSEVSRDTETEKFISAIERQQELMNRQLDIIEKRDEQIDRLITLLERK